MHDSTFKYKPGRLVKPAGGFCGLQEQCAEGIHFFLNVHDAVHYS